MIMPRLHPEKEKKRSHKGLNTAVRRAGPSIVKCSHKGLNTAVRRAGPSIYKGFNTAVRRARPSIVCVFTHVPGDMTGYNRMFRRGIILQSEVDGDAYSSTILAPANLFKCHNGIEPDQVECDVFVPDGNLYKGKLLKCDFHYNLALIRIISGSRLRPATLRALNDVSSINIDDYEDPQSDGHPNLFKVQTGTKIIAVTCSIASPFEIEGTCGVFCAYHFLHNACKEVYWVDSLGTKKPNTGAVINLSGEVMGIILDTAAFLPSNFISKWWDNYKSNRVCRPWVGVEVANLAEAKLRILDQLKSKFSDISTGVIVTMVEKDTPAYRSGLRVEDVIIECGRKPIRSKIQFFESMWDNAGKYVRLTVVRLSDGRRWNKGMSISETSTDNYYRWSGTLGRRQYC